MLFLVNDFNVLLLAVFIQAKFFPETHFINGNGFIFNL
jgi:hypothetical protein